MGRRNTVAACDAAMRRIVYSLQGGGIVSRKLLCRLAGPAKSWISLMALLISPGVAGAQQESAVSSNAPADQPSAGPQTGSKPGNDILNLDIEQLAKTPVVVPSMDIPVTSVTKEQSTVGRSAAAVFVITNEMIRRSGATCIPEALRMAPGLDVAQINSSTWAISSRGFNGLNANKLLVLIDGRTVYTPVSSGVFWDVQDVVLEDVERIEVIRGPGGTLWGANAVNGVINVITKKAKDTPRGLCQRRRRNRGTLHRDRSLRRQDRRGLLLSGLRKILRPRPVLRSQPAGQRRLESRPLRLPHRLEPGSRQERTA